MVQFMSAEQAAELIQDGDAVAMLGNGGMTVEPRLVYRAIGERFAATGLPRDLTLIHSAGIGDRDTEGLNRFAQPGLTKRVIGGHWAWAPRMQQLATSGQIEAYNLPQGVICQQYREIAARRPGLITRTGLGTFVDPRKDGGRLNAATTEDLVELIEISGQTYLRYLPWRIDVGIIKGSVADVDGNITFVDEVAFLEAQAIAQAAHNCGGLVIAQVRQVVERGTLHPQLVKVPGILVDVIVVDPDQWQTSQGAYDPALCGAQRRPDDGFEPMPLTHRKVIARRAALELEAGQVINLGFGIPDGVASVANEAGVLDLMTATIEQGLIGGIPAQGDIFGAAYNAEAFVDAPAQFDFYAGGGLDLTCLGMAEVDRIGNVNVSRFGPTIAGCGGFIDISQAAQNVIFCGTFTAGGLVTQISEGRLRILREGRARKFVHDVEHVTFSGSQSVNQGQRIRYVTERAVFGLTADGLELLEIAPGIDLQKQILDEMDFRPGISAQLCEMPPELFADGPMVLQLDS